MHRDDALQLDLRGGTPDQDRIFPVFHGIPFTRHIPEGKLLALQREGDRLLFAGLEMHPLKTGQLLQGALHAGLVGPHIQLDDFVAGERTDILNGDADRQLPIRLQRIRAEN